MKITRDLCVYLSEFCNFKCSFCKNQNVMNNKFYWTADTTEKLKRIITESHFDIVVFSGGEPTLNPTIFKEVVSMVKSVSPDSKLIMHTNGSMFTEELLEFCKENNIHLNISINFNGEKGLSHFIQYSKSPSNIIELIRNYENKAISFVISRKYPFAEEAILLHQIFNSKIRLATNHREWSQYDKTDAKWLDTEWSKIQKYDKNAFNTWADITQYSYRAFTYAYFHQFKLGKLYLPTPYPYSENHEYVREMDPNIKRLIDYTAEKYIPNNLFSAISKAIPLKTYTILTGLDCNLRCKYCYEKTKNNKVNSLENIITFLDYQFKQDFGKKNSDRNCQVCLDFIGGEPLLHPELLEKVIDHVLELKREYSIPYVFASLSTNGTLITRPNVIKLLDKYGYLLNIGFSIDGTKEVHDSQRIDINGNGSYDEAIKGFKFLQQNYPYIYTSVKATFTHQTISKYAESIINLINLGFRHISANVVYEELWPVEECDLIIPQFEILVDYIFNNNLYKSLTFTQLYMPSIFHYTPFIKKTRNWCGSCDPMRCIGFDGLIYGCQRFCTMSLSQPIGYLDKDKEQIVITEEGQKLINDVKNQYDLLPEDCKKCPISGQCPSCCVVPYEMFPNDKDAVKKYFALKSQCGWTNAVVSAKIYYAEKWRELHGLPTLMNYDNVE